MSIVFILVVFFKLFFRFLIWDFSFCNLVFFIRIMICYKNILLYYFLYFNVFLFKLIKIFMLFMVIIDLYFIWVLYSFFLMVVLSGIVVMVLFWMKFFSLLIFLLIRLFNCLLLYRKRRDFLLYFIVYNILYMYTLLFFKIVIFIFLKLSLKDILIIFFLGEDVDSD